MSLDILNKIDRKPAVVCDWLFVKNIQHFSIHLESSGISSQNGVLKLVKDQLHGHKTMPSFHGLTLADFKISNK